MSTKVKVINVRLSFPVLWEPREYTEGDGKPRYDANFLIEKGSANDKAVRAAIREIAAESWGAKAQVQLKAISGDSGKFCYADGDLTEREENANHMILSTHRRASDGPPAIVDRMKNKLTINDGKPYSGCYVNGSVELWVQKGKFTGIRCSLIGIQFVADGDAFAGAPSSDDAFEDLGDDSAETDEFSNMDDNEDGFGEAPADEFAPDDDDVAF